MPLQQTDSEVWKRRSDTLSTLITNAAERFSSEESFKSVHAAKVLRELEKFRKRLTLWIH